MDAGNKYNHETNLKRAGLSRDDLRFVATLAGFTILIKLAFFFWGGVEPFQGADSHSFYSLATNFARGDGLVYVDNGTPDMVFRSFRPPLYPFLMGLVFKVAGESTTVILLLQLLLGTVSVVLLFTAGKLLFDDSVARWAGFLGSLYWVSSYFDNQIYTETLFVFLFLAANVLVFRCATRDCRGTSAWRALLCGAVYGLAILCRPAAVAALPPVLLWFFFSGEGPKKRLLLSAVLIAGGAVAVMTPWWIRNYVIHDTFVPFVTSGGLNFWGGNQIEGGAHSITKAWRIMESDSGALSETGWDRWFYNDAFTKIQADPAHFVTVLRMKLVLFVWPLQNNFYQLPYRFLFPFFLLGIGAAFGRFRQSSVLYLILASQTAVAVLYAAHARYRYSIDYYLILLAAVAIAGLMRTRPREKQFFGRVVLASVLGAGFLLWKLEPVLIAFIRLWFIIPIGLLLVFIGYRYLCMDRRRPDRS